MLLAAWSMCAQPERFELCPDRPVRVGHFDAAHSPALESPALASERTPASNGATPFATNSPDAAPLAPQSARLDVLFTREGFPFPGVGAWLTSEPASGREPKTTPGAEGAVPKGAIFLESKSDGVASFTDLAPGRHRLAFDVVPGRGRPTRYVANLLFTGQTYEVRLGSARVLGRVFDAKGRPAPAVLVSVSPRQPDPISKLVVSAYALTDAHGQVEITELRAGEYDVVIERDGRFDGFSTVERQGVTLASGETKTVQFGGEPLSATWRGTVTNSFGQPFEGVGRLRLVQADVGDEKSTPIASDGRFALPITPGTWNVFVHVTGAPEAGHALGEIELDDRDLERDLVVPGARLRGRILGVDPELLADPNRAAVVNVHLEGHEYPAAFRSVAIRSDGSFAIDGLEPGRWLLGAWPIEIEGGEQRVDILGGMPVIDRDLSVRSR